RSTEAASAEANEEETSGRDPAASMAPSGTAAPEQTTNRQAGPDLSAVPRDSASLAEMESQRTVARYKLANSLFLAASRPDSAATWYRRILQESGDHPVAKRALYALAEAYRAQGDSTAARQAYRRLADQYPDTDLAVRARERLDRTERTPTDNRPARADSAYARAYEHWQQEAESTSPSQFLDVAARYPETDAAPRALLAAGIMYWKQVQRDSTEASQAVLRRYLGRLRTSDSTRSDSMKRLGRAPDADAPATPSPVAGTAASAQFSTGDTSQSVVRPVDTSRAARGTQVPSSLPDSARVPNDTLVADTTQKDTSTAAASIYAPLNALMMHLTERYPEAPQVSQARSILALIEEQRPDAAERLADTTATDTTVTDTTAVDTGTVEAGGRGRNSSSSARPADSIEERREEKETTQDDSTPLPAPTGRRAQPDGNADGGDRGIDLKQGGWTLLVQTLTSSEEASTRIAEVGRRIGGQWPVDLLKEIREDATQYRLVVGQFQSREAATEAQKRVAEQLRRRPQVWALSNAESGSQ
ncbi:MAG TPA: tetratricopeptide repeat protein, partial [Salinibacter sp.]|nr:tetratricopeptide repeat protein [Salinibacter sp.]